MRTCAIVLVLVASVSAQAPDPLSYPLANLSAVQAKGSWTFDWSDGAGGDLSYGGGALGVSEDGRFLYVSCLRDQRIAKVEIPTVAGAKARVVAPCSGPDAAEIGKIHPDPSAGQKRLGGVLELGGPAGVLAQPSDPRTLPLVQPSDIAYVGRFTLPQTDGTGRPVDEGWLTWGGTALGLGPDGASLYFGCHDWGKRLARVSIPAIGGVGSVVEPCAPIANLTGINPQGGTSVLGGSLAWGGRLTVSAYTYYDASGTATASHFVGPDVSTQTGPHRVGTRPPGFVGGYMGVIPPEWRALLGGPALTGQCCLAIIGRSSHGPSVSVFDPADIGVVSPVPSTMLVGYDNTHPLGSWGSYNPLFTGATSVGGVAFPAGTRSVLFVGVHGGTFCYGSGTGNPALAGTPDGQGNLYCYDPTSSAKGTHGYPYQHQVWAYDATDLLAVKQGTKQPWEVRPYATWTISDITTSGGATLRSATYDPATRRLYVTTGQGDGAPVVHVFGVGAGSVPPPPPPVPTATLVANPTSVATGNTAGLCWTTAHADSATITPGVGVVTPTAGGCVDVTPTQTTAYALTAPGAGGSVTVTATVTVVTPPPPPPPPAGFSGILRAQTPYTVAGLVAGLRLALQVNDQDIPAIPGVGAAVTLPLPLTDGTVDRRVCAIWKVEPTGYSTRGASTRVTVQCQGISGVRLHIDTAAPTGGQP